MSSMAELVNRATTKDACGRNQTARKRIVFLSRYDCNFSCQSCLAILEIVASVHGVEASAVRQMRQPPACGGAADVRDHVPGIRADRQIPAHSVS